MLRCTACRNIRAHSKAEIPGHIVGLDAGHTVGLSLCANVALWPRTLQKLQCPTLILP